MTAAAPSLPATSPAAPARGRVALLAGALAAALAALALPEATARLVHAPRAEAVIGAIHRDPLLLEAVRAQNLAWRDRDADWARAQDRIWTAERRGGVWRDQVLASPASRRLRELVAASGGAARQVILIDEAGRIAAIARPAFNFWQNPKPKYRRTYLLGPGVRHVNALEPGHDGTFTACWVSETLSDPATGRPVGAFGVELDHGLVGSGICRPTP